MNAYGLDWIAMFCGTLGCYLVGRGVRIGWLVFASASAINIFVGFHSGILGMAVGACIYCCLEIKGWIQHHKKPAIKNEGDRDEKISRDE